MKKLFMLLSLLTVLAMVAACGGQPAAPPTQPPEPTTPPQPTATEAPPAPSGEPITIGLMTDQSGVLAIYGPMQERGFRLGLEYATDGSMEAAGHPLKISVKDNGSDPEKAVTQARELIEAEGAKILVGTVSSGATLAVSEVAKENKVILIAEPAASPAITGQNFNPYVFRTSRNSVQDALTMASYLTDVGKTFIQIAPDYAFGYGSAAGFYGAVKALGGEFVINDTSEKSGAVFIPLDTTDFTPYLNQVLDAKADVLIVTWAGAGFVPLFQQMQELGVFDEMTVATGMGDNQTLAAGYTNAIGSVGVSVYHYTLPHNDVNDWLVKRHQEEYGSPPDLFTAGGFAAAQLVVAALEKTGGDTSADALIPVLEGMEFDGPKGKYIIRDYDHVALQPMYLVELTNVDDPDFKFLKLIKEFGPEETASPCMLAGDYADRCP